MCPTMYVLVFDDEPREKLASANYSIMSNELYPDSHIFDMNSS